jgi:hypothetical protein
MAATHRMLASFWLTAMVIPLGGCLNPGTGPTKLTDYFIIDLVDEFGFDQPSDSWQFTTADAWGIQSDGQRRFLYVSPRPVGQKDQAATIESSLHRKYRFRNFSFSCRVRTDKATGGMLRDACVLFGRQDNLNGFRLDLIDLADKPEISLSRIDNGRATRLASATPTPRSEFVRREWHQVGILRNLESSTVEVYVDEGVKPLLRARTTAYPWGAIGLGSTTGGAAFGRVMISGEATSVD